MSTIHLHQTTTYRLRRHVRTKASPRLKGARWR